MSTSTGTDLIATGRQPPEPGGLSKEALARNLRRVRRARAPRPKVTRSAYQRLYDMILASGRGDVRHKGAVTRYKFFDDPDSNGQTRSSAGEDAHQPGQHPQEPAAPVRHRAAGPPAARAGQFQSTIARS